MYVDPTSFKTVTVDFQLDCTDIWCLTAGSNTLNNTRFMRVALLVSDCENNSGSKFEPPAATEGGEGGRFQSHTEEIQSLIFDLVTLTRTLHFLCPPLPPPTLPTGPLPLILFFENRCVCLGANVISTTVCLPTVMCWENIEDTRCLVVTFIQASLSVPSLAQQSLWS